MIIQPLSREYVTTKRVIRAALGCVFAVAFIVSPYWAMTSSLILRWVLLGAILGLGILWAAAAAGEARLRVEVHRLPVMAILFAAILALNIRSLMGALSWRGDELTHITRILELVDKTPLGWILYFASVIAFVLFAAWRQPKWVLVPAIALVAGAAAFGSRPDGITLADAWILRYPLLNYWIFMLAPKFASLTGGLYTEALYRIVPFAAMCALAWTFQRRAPGGDGPVGSLWGLAIATVPVVFYYSSILYTEPAAVALMLAACLNIEVLLQTDSAAIRQQPGWYALILVGFVRETTLPFLLFFVVCRTAYQLRSRRAMVGPDKPSESVLSGERGDRLRQLVYGEAQVVYATLLPIILFIVLRSSLGSPRTYTPVLQAVLNPSVYRAIAQSFIEQFGAWLLLFAVGCWVLVRQKDYNTPAFLLLVAIGTPILSGLDRDGIYAGYSRFNLLVLPSILAGTAIALKHVPLRRLALTTLLPCLLIAVNLLQSPIHLDGTKVPFWGNYLYDTSEHYYPYPEALSWIKQNAPDDRILFGRPAYGYGFGFYFNQLGWHPQYTAIGIRLPVSYDRVWDMYFVPSAWHPKRALDTLIAESNPQGEVGIVLETLRVGVEGDFGVVVYQVLGEHVPAVQGDSDYQLQKIFVNEAHSLMVFVRSR